MRLSEKDSKKINYVVISISILTWILLLVNPEQILGTQHCHAADSEIPVMPLQILGNANSILFQLTGWGLMVLAMMLPKLIMSIQHIYVSSFKHQRVPLILLFVFGYMSVWMAVGTIMIAIILAASPLMPNPYFIAIGLGVAAIVWQFSPAKQRCLNRGHEHWMLSAFGWSAYYDAFLFGVMHGMWCVGSGWAIMLFPMVLPAGHNLMMIIVTFIMISEHLEHPKVPRWQIDFRGKLFRIIAAQTLAAVEKNKTSFSQMSKSNL